MKKNYFLFGAIVFFSMHAVATDGLKFDIGAGIQIDAKDAAKLVNEAAEAGRKAYERKETSLQKKIAQCQAAMEKSAADLAAKKITEKQCEIIIKGHEREIALANKKLENLENNADDFGNKFRDLAHEGLKGYMEVYKADKLQEGEIKKAAVSAAAKAEAEQELKNKADIEMLKMKFQHYSDPKVLLKSGAFLGATALGIATSYYAAKFGYQYCDAKLNKPTLVLESSRKGMFDGFVSYFWDRSPTQAIFNDVIMESSLKSELIEFASETKNLVAFGENYRNLLLYGPPGTGKTMFAKLMAQYTGMDYAIVPGGNIITTEQVNQLFSWAATSKNGMVIFIDEADAFLKTRSELNHEQQRLLNTFLSYTEDYAHKVAFVFATNRPNVLDAAVKSRIAKQVEVGLPGKYIRRKLVKHYWNKFITGAEKPLSADKSISLDTVADKLTGFSGRNIKDLLYEIRIKGFGAKGQKVTANLVDTCIKKAVAQQTKEMEDFA